MKKISLRDKMFSGCRFLVFADMFFGLLPSVLKRGAFFGEKIRRKKAI